MSTEDVIVSLKDNIQIITLNRPARRNAINIDMYVRLTDILNAAAIDDAILITVLTGAGSYYSSGNDLRSSFNRLSSNIIDDAKNTIKAFVDAFIEFPKILVAVVNGPAIGIAATTLGLCDLVFASENAFFYTPFTKLGLVAEGCSSYTFPKIMGKLKAFEMLTCNHKMSSKEALEYGFVNDIFKPEEIQTKVWDRINEVAHLPKNVVLESKKLLTGYSKDDLLNANVREVETLANVWMSEEFLNSVQAFSKKRNSTYGREFTLSHSMTATCNGAGFTSWRVNSKGGYERTSYSKLSSEMRTRSASYGSLADLFHPSNPRGLRSRVLSTTRLESLKKEIDTDSHLIPLDDLFTRYESDPVCGLTHELAAQRLAYNGPNTLTPASQDHVLQVLFRCMCTGFSILIWLGAALCSIAYFIEYMTKTNPSKDNLYLAVVLVCVDVICGLFSFVQTYQSSKIMATFNSMLPVYAHCIRDGVANTHTNVSDLVKGDIVKVKAGDVVPADIRIIDSHSFKVDNSSLTGESVAVPRFNTEGNKNILESLNVAFFSTQCVEGHATGVVLCCGDLTALGRVAGLAARLKPAPAPLSKEIKSFMRCISIWALTLGLLIGVSSLCLGYPFVETVVFVIGIIVANVPEGLQPTVTASLTLTAKRMVARNCLVKNLEAVEALGATTTICSDKTGTLTENKMAVQHVWLYNQNYLATNMQVIDELDNNGAFNALVICGALCSTAAVSADGTITGDASESAILTFLYKINEPSTLRENFPKVAEIPFNSADKFQVSVHLDRANSRYVLMLKGAPEAIISRCNCVAINYETRALSSDVVTAANNATDVLASSGERVLAFADLELDKRSYPLEFEFTTDNVNFPLKNYRLLGLMGLIDPPRKQVLAAIKRVREAGVRVMMVTGDHPMTAKAIAEEVGIATSDSCKVVTGSDLREMSTDVLDNVLTHNYEIVFARTSPTQKLQIVEACQRHGAIVAVTGDGVNDAPALKKADIGISMGITGSQVSKQTADIILMDDNFATIVVGIEEGRKIFDNLKKSIAYILISNVPEIVPVLMFILCSIPLPLGVMTILCVDLGTDMWPAVGLAYEPAEADVMVRPPRQPRKDALVSGRMIYLAYAQLGLVEACAGMFAYFVVMAEHGFFPRELFGIRERWDSEVVSDVRDSFGQEWNYSERKELEYTCHTAYFVAVVMMQIMNCIICRTRYNSLFQQGLKNNVLNMGIAFELALACFIIYTPGVRVLFRTYPMNFRWWLLSLPFTLFMFVFDEIRKYCIRKKLFDDWFTSLTYY